MAEHRYEIAQRLFRNSVEMVYHIGRISPRELWLPNLEVLCIDP